MVCTFQSLRFSYAVVIAVFVFLVIVTFIFSGCRKLVDISDPVNTITTSKTFSSDANATSAIISIYSRMSFCQNGNYYSSGLITINAGMSADEFRQFGNSDNEFWNMIVAKYRCN